MVAPKAGKAAAAMKKSARNRALPMSALVYFLRIMAMMSVPPVEALAVMAVLEAAVRSAESGMVQTLDLSDDERNTLR